MRGLDIDALIFDLRGQLMVKSADDTGCFDLIMKSLCSIIARAFVRFGIRVIARAVQVTTHRAAHGPEGPIGWPKHLMLDPKRADGIGTEAMQPAGSSATPAISARERGSIGAE
jgi:hypothetical protein